MKQSLLLAFAFIAFQSFAQNLEQYGISPENAPEGLDVGDVAPDFTAKSVDGETFSLSDALRKDAVAIVFYRGYWCGYCSQALEAYADSLSYLTEIGIKVVAVTPETAENVAKTEQKSHTNFPVISDEGAEIMRAFDVDFRVTDAYNSKVAKSQGMTLEEINDSETAELPIPATYLIVRDGKSDNGVVVWRHFDPNYKERASVKQIRDALLSLD